MHILLNNSLLPPKEIERLQDKEYCKIVVYNQEIDGEVKTRNHMKWTEAGRRFVFDLWKEKLNKTTSKGTGK